MGKLGVHRSGLWIRRREHNLAPDIDENRRRALIRQLIAIALRQERLKRNWMTVERMAGFLGIHPLFYHHIEQGKWELSEEMLTLIALQFNMHLMESELGAYIQIIKASSLEELRERFQRPRL